MEPKDRPFSRNEVVNIINSVASKIKGGQGADANVCTSLYKELQDLALYIDQARSEIASMGPKAIGEEHIPQATDELDAVVQSTEEATGKIMDACDVIQSVADGMSDAGQKNKIEEQITGIYEACSFQDITGQRITKVVSVLRHIENQVDALVSAFGLGDGAVSANTSVPAQPEQQGDEALLNGPQMPEDAISQDDIDKLLASFD